jgi:RNA polymerase sigma factor (TIGR02999 family)
MSVPSSEDLTQILQSWSKGDQQALDKLIPIVYDELRRLAHHYMIRERPGHTLQTTALVHEAYLRLIDQRNANWQNRAHFFAIAAQIMRRILVDQFRSNRAAKHGGLAQQLSFDEAIGVSNERDVDLQLLDEALIDLAALDKQQSMVVELRIFGGLTVQETAEVLQISPTTVKREWRMAKAWLYNQISSK